ncbi:MAG: hypothetical protein ABI893_00985 [Polaromonas sp.]|uniref:hypothetical protein n=1 Tax=Polaromonas sp. TaxID=1869339 RepID=UPI003265A1AD
MAVITSKIGVQNHRGVCHVVAVEPWGEDFTLLPGEALEIIAVGDAATPWFNLVEWDGSSQVYCEDTAIFKVMQGTLELKCGHNRQPSSSE